MKHAHERSSGIPGRAAAALATAVALLLAACGSGSGGESSLTVNGDVPLAYVKRVNTLSMNPTNGAPSAPGGDLMLREKSSPSAPEHNLTQRYTRGVGDASDPEVSYDGKKIVFAMKCPVANNAAIGEDACTGRWNIWEYDMGSGGLTGGTFRRVTSSTTDDDVDPVYLPGDGGFVFSSNRQAKSKTIQANGQVYYAVDEYERERVFNLHTAKPDGTAIEQISFNQSHDRNPVILENGEVLFSRWEHVGPRNRFAIFRSRPDGTDMFVRYGAHSSGNSFLHPREMDTQGRFAGKLASSLMPLSRTQEGGALVFVDAANYSEENTPATPLVDAIGGQVQPTADALNDGRGLSMKGRITTPFPLWDGSDRVLVSYRACEVRRAGEIIPCSQLTPDEIARLGDRERLAADIAADPLRDDVPPSYAVYMFDPRDQSFKIVAAPPPGYMFTDPVPIQARRAPRTLSKSTPDEALAAEGKALLEVRSIYDTDGLNRMSDPVIAPADLSGSCTTAIPKTAPTDPKDTRARVADLLKLKDPADPAYHCTPVRWVRAVRAVAPQAGTMGMREAIGETDFEPQQIVGYAPIEPDGSFRLKVPADVPLALSVLDGEGRALQTHLNWIQVRPGERRTCDGCHSPRRGASLNSTNVVNTLPTAWKPAMRAAHESGQTMASLRTSMNAAALLLDPNLFFDDIWADTTQPGITKRATLSIRYTGNTLADGTTPDAASDLATPAPVNGLINYPDHIAPLWTRARPGGSCASCHADPAKLDLRATLSGTGRLTSYEELLVGDPTFDAQGNPVTRIEDGVPVIVRGAALVEPMAGNAGGIARSSRLTEILSGQVLLASAESRTTFPTPSGSAPNHATMLNKAEKRLLAEWMDLGGQYFNDFGGNGSPVRSVVSLSQASYEAQVHPVLQAQCAMCHQPTGNSGAAGTTTTTRNRFVLTGDVEGDYNVTLTMVSNTCDAASNALLKKPSTIPHPAGATGQTTAVLPVGSTAYNAIAGWIGRGCPTP